MKKYQIVKTVTATSMALCLVMAGLTACPRLSGLSGRISRGSDKGLMPDVVQAAENETFEVCTIMPVNSQDDVKDIPAGLTVKGFHVERGDSSWHRQYFKAELPEDSWAYFSGCYSNNVYDGLETHVKIYSDEGMTHLVGEYGWGYWEYTNSFSGELKKGTYYACIASKHANFSEFDGDINIIAARMPVDKYRESASANNDGANNASASGSTPSNATGASSGTGSSGISPSETTDSSAASPGTKKKIAATAKLSENKKKAVITAKNRTGAKAKKIQYLKGSVGKNSKAWSNSKTVKKKNGKYSFTVKKNGTYTVRLTAKSGKKYTVKVKVKGIR